MPENKWLFEDLKFDDFNKDVTGSSQNHFYLGRKWRIYGLKNNFSPFPLLYGSLEFRLCLERLVFEIYIMLSRAELIENGLSESELERIDNSFRSMVSVITEHAGNMKRLRKYFIYCKYHIRVLNDIKVEPSIPNLKVFDSHWGNLSKYLHYTQVPDDTWLNKSWVVRGYDVLHKVESYIYSLMFDKNALATVQIPSIADELKELLYKFINDEIEEDSLPRRMLIMKPVLAKRAMPSGNKLLRF